MNEIEVISTDTGLDVLDLREDEEFRERQLHTRKMSTQMEGMQRLARAFLEQPDTILTELVRAAVELCGADSAGISVERENPTDKEFYEWVAIAGVYSGFLNAILPRYPSACTICLERGRPQHFRVHRRFFEILGVEAPLVVDGILLPWEVDGTRGTIFILSHENADAFDSEDVRMMKMLADFAAMGVRQQKQQARLLEHASAAAAAALANDLAHQINNPLQSVVNLLYLADESKESVDAKALSKELAEPITRLSVLVARLLTLRKDVKQSVR